MNDRIILQMPRPVRRRLQKLMRKTRDAALRTRIQIVLHFHDGFGSHRIAKMLGCAPATAVRVANRFRHCGEEALLDGRKDNGHPKIDDDLLQALAEIVSHIPEDFSWPRPTWTKELLALTLSDQTRVGVSVTTVSRMLKMLNARWGMAKPVVACPWTKHKKSRCVNRIERILANIPSDEVAYYEDELDVHLNPRIGRDWMLRGQQKLILTPGQNKKRYLAGALAADGSDLVFVSSDRKNSALFISLLEKLRETHPNAKKIHLVLDNYKIHSSKIVQRYLARHKGLFVLHFLPPYCPDHNKIERFWRDLHANVTRNHRCRTIEHLMDKVKTFLHRTRRKLKRSSSEKNRESANIRRAA